MIIKKNVTTALLGGTILSLALAVAPVHAQSDTAEDAVENMGDAASDMSDEAEMNMEAAADDMEDAADDMGSLDETAMMIQDQIATDPALASYQLEVRRTDEDMYSVTGMMDSDDYATLQRMLGDIDGVDASMIDNRVVVQ